MSLGRMSRDVREQESFSSAKRVEAGREEEPGRLGDGLTMGPSQRTPAQGRKGLAARPPGEAQEPHGEGTGPGDASTLLLTVREAAALLRTTPKAIYHRAERGRLPGLVHDGRRVLVRRQELLRSLTEVRVPSPGGPRR